MNNRILCILFALGLPLSIQLGRAATTDLDLQIESAVQVSFLTETGKLYEIESSPDVDPPNWVVEGATISGTGQRYTRTFLSSEARRIYRVVEGSTTAGLVGYYPFNGNASDESGTGNHATVTGASLAMNRFAQTAKAYSFSQSGQYIRTDTAVGFASGTQDFTVSMWVNASRFVANEHGMLFSNLAADQFQLDLSWGTVGRPEIHFHTGTQGSPDALAPAMTWELNRWYNVQITRQGNTITIYRDGVRLDQSQTTQGNGASAANRRLVFGYRTVNAGHQFYGSLDDIRVYNRALSSLELRAIRDVVE